jgi:hypothetical protein
MTFQRNIFPSTSESSSQDGVKFKRSLTVIITAVKISNLAWCLGTDGSDGPLSSASDYTGLRRMLIPEVGGSKLFRNVDKYLAVYMTKHPRRLDSYSLLFNYN